jgi:hypothetical protein
LGDYNACLELEEKGKSKESDKDTNMSFQLMMLLCHIELGNLNFAKSFWNRLKYHKRKEKKIGSSSEVMWHLTSQLLSKSPFNFSNARFDEVEDEFASLRVYFENKMAASLSRI